MKVKQRPEDFFVEELTDVAPADRGDFALYRLDKRGWSTPDAMAAVRRRWPASTGAIGVGASNRPPGRGATAPSPGTSTSSDSGRQASTASMRPNGVSPRTRA
jgi:hypothetical protein